MKIKVLICLDMLLDTRAAILDVVYGIPPSRFMALPAYRKRHTDAALADIAGVPLSEWQETWSTRASLTSSPLTHSIMTNLAPTLPKLLIAGLKTLSDWDLVEEAEIVINTFPYSLSEEEGELIAEFVKHNDLYDWPPIFTTRCESISYKSQTAAYLDMRGFNSLFLYDLTEWVKYREPEWKQNKFHHHISVQAPKLGTHDMDVRKTTRTLEETFEQTELYYRLTGLMTLSFIEVDSVCALWDSRQT